MIDWKAKVDCIQTAASMGIQRYVFYSIDKCEQHKEVPLMNMKYATEEYLKASGMNYTVLRLCGFMQPLNSRLRRAHPGGAAGGARTTTPAPRTWTRRMSRR